MVSDVFFLIDTGTNGSESSGNARSASTVTGSSDLPSGNVHNNQNTLYNNDNKFAM